MISEHCLTAALKFFNNQKNCQKCDLMRGRIFSQGYKVFPFLFMSLSSNILSFQRLYVSENIFIDCNWVVAIVFSYKNLNFPVISEQKSDYLSPKIV